MKISYTLSKEIYGTLHFLNQKSIVITLALCLVIVHSFVVVGLGLPPSTTTIVMFGLALLSATTTSTTTIMFVVSGILK